MCGTRVQCSVLCDRDLCRAQRASKRSATIYQRLSAFWEEAISRSIQRSAYFVALQELLDLPVGSLGQQVQSSTEYMQLIDPTDITEKQLLQVTECVRTARVLAVRLNEISHTKFGSLTESMLLSPV